MKTNGREGKNYAASVLIFLAAFVLFPQATHAASYSLKWVDVIVDEEGNQNDGSVLIIEDGGTYATPLQQARRMTFLGIPPDTFVYGKLYRVGDDSSREYISNIYYGDYLAFERAGVYEVDMYEMQVMLTHRSPMKFFASIFLGEIAYAEEDGFIFAETIRFTVTDANAPSVEECCSSVMFLPGFEASRLYQTDGSGERKVWEPHSMQSDAQKLYLDANGNSINQTYTKAGAAIDSVGPSGYRTDIYRTFLAQLAELKTSDTINGFLVFPYDWRMSVVDIVENGTAYDGGTHYPAEELETLAADSQTKKVTIVAHSNGGLLAKALMRKLEAEGKAGLVDKVILVGTPQLGTPKAVASMLHGDFQNIPGWAGFMVSKANARALGENMKGAFGLLPSAAYFDRVADPVIDVSAAPGLRVSGGLASPLVDDSGSFAGFMLGAGGRAKPAYNDTETPDVLSSTLLAQAVALHTDLDGWTPPAGVEVIQIAGWGLDTPKSITYTEKRVAFCLASLCTYATTTQHAVNMTEDGDKTVVSASAAIFGDWPTYYIKQREYNNQEGKKTDHSNLTETQPFQELFGMILTASSLQSLPQYITQTLPAPTTGEKRLRLRVLSPVSLDAYDSFGNHTGMAANPDSASDLLYKEEKIPNSYYEEFGEGKYLGLPAVGTYSISLHGLDTGTFTFETTPVTGGVEGTTMTYKDIPVTEATIATLTLTDGTQAPLSVDSNGDGKIDIVLASSTQSTDIPTYITLIKATIKGMDMGSHTKRELAAKFTNVGYMLAKTDKWDRDDDDEKESKKGDKSTSLVLKKIEKIEKYIKEQLAKSKPSKKGKVSSDRIGPAEAQALLDMLLRLKQLVIMKQP